MLTTESAERTETARAGSPSEAPVQQWRLVMSQRTRSAMAVAGFVLAGSVLLATPRAQQGPRLALGRRVERTPGRLPGGIQGAIGVDRHGSPADPL